MFAVLAVVSRSAYAAEQKPQLLVDVDHRKAMSLNGEWHTIVDPYSGSLYDAKGEVLTGSYFKNRKAKDKTDLVEYNFATSPVLKVPGDWNTQRPDLFLYEGAIWYEKDFKYTKTAGKRVFLHVGAANYRSYVAVNGEFVCRHEGGFTPFDCEVTEQLKDGDNFAVIAVDSTRLKDGVPTLKTDWWNYGGLTRDVSLVEVPRQFIDDYELHLVRGTDSKIEGYVHVEQAAAGRKVTVRIPGLKLEQAAETNAEGRARFAFDAKGLESWSPETPKLYQVEMQAGEDRLADDVGFRTIEVKGTEILLNGKPVFLRGVCIHAEAPYRTGRANREQDVETLLGWVHELGGNFVRLAHYPHDEHMTRLADRMGILVWSEIPVYWSLDFANPVVLAKAEQQLHEMIRRDKNKAAVVLWSVANETPVSESRNAVLKGLIDSVHEQDPTRLVTAALLVGKKGTTMIANDPIGQYMDVLSCNEYMGWYGGGPADIDAMTWDIAYQKPMIMSEFGGGAVAGRHADADTRWSEEFQARIYEHQLPMLAKIPQLRGISPWVLMDFRSPERKLPGVQDFFNRKGLVSDQGLHKEAFEVVQKAYKSGWGKAE